LIGWYFKNSVGGEFLSPGEWVADGRLYPRAAFDPIEIGLLTDDAPRDTRMRLLQCQTEQWVGPGQRYGCGIMLKGHAAECENTGVLGTHSDVCIVVEAYEEIQPSEIATASAR
jgi:hypothetical protein